jgi:DNA-binding CsgD family transcriptional regulator
MNQELLVEAAPVEDLENANGAFDAAMDPDGLWSLTTVPELSARLAAAHRAARFDGATLVVAAPTTPAGYLRLVEEGRRMPPPDLAPDALGRLFGDALGRSAVPFRWNGLDEGGEIGGALSTYVLRDCGRAPVAFSGLCVPVRAGLARVGGVIFVGRGRAPLRALDVSALRIFALNWFARFSQVEAAVGERAHVTPRERECLQLASNGMTSEAIARRLSLSKHTVDHHLVSATIKLKAANRAHAIAESLRLGIVV